MIKIRLNKPMPTRPCQYCFSLQDDSVFADFSVSKTGGLYLVRISFDGFGCCYPDPMVSIGEINVEKSKRLQRIIKNNNLDNPEASEILREYFDDNKNALWPDALMRHGLVNT